MRSVPMWRAALPTWSVAAARSTRSARKRYWSSSHSLPSTRGRAWRPRCAFSTPDGLQKLADGARDKDRGVARLARKRLDAMANREDDAVEADAIVAQLEALASDPGPILTKSIELNRRWQALNLDDDPVRLARCEAARQALQARFDREHAEQRARMQFEHRLERMARQGGSARHVGRIGRSAQRGCRAARRGSEVRGYLGVKAR